VSGSRCGCLCVRRVELCWCLAREVVPTNKGNKQQTNGAGFALYVDFSSCSISILPRQLKRGMHGRGHYPACPLAAGIRSLLKTPGFLSSPEPGKVCLPPPPPQPPGPNTMTVPRHGSTTEAASQVRQDGQPRAGPMTTSNSTWWPGASSPPTPAALPRMPFKSTSRAGQGVSRGVYHAGHACPVMAATQDAR